MQKEQPLIFKASRRKYALFIALFLSFLAVILFLPTSVKTNGVDDSLVKTILVPFLGFTTLFFFWLLVRGEPRLTLSSSGLQIKNLRSLRFVQWADMDQLSLTKIQNNSLLAWNYRQECGPIQGKPVPVAGFNDGITTFFYDIKPELLFAEFKRRQEADRVNNGQLLEAQISAVKGTDDAFALSKLGQQLMSLNRTTAALPLLGRAAFLGNHEAQLKLGTYLESKEVGTGLVWLRRATDALPAASEALADALLKQHNATRGATKQKIPEEILNQYRIAAKAGTISAQINLGILMGERPGYEVEGKQWMRTAAQAGDDFAARYLRSLERPRILQKLPDWTGLAVIGVLLILIYIRQILVIGFTPDPVALDHLGAVSKIGLARGEWWRVLTAELLHGSLQHIVYNLFALLMFGLILSVRAGLSATIVVFTVSGVVASLFSSLLGAPNIVSVGASGAIFGVMAFGAVVGATSRADYFKRLGKRGIPVFMYLFAAVFVPHIDHLAHIGGALSGFALAAIWRTPNFVTRAALAGICSVAVGFSTLVIFNANRTGVSIDGRQCIQTIYLDGVDAPEGIRYYVVDEQLRQSFESSLHISIDSYSWITKACSDLPNAQIVKYH